MFYEIHVNAPLPKLPACPARFTRAGTMKATGRDFVGRFYAQRFRITRRQIGRDFGSRPPGKHKRKIRREADVPHVFPLFRKGKKLGSGVLFRDTRPHFSIFPGKEIPGHVYPEKFRGRRGRKIAVEIGFKLVKLAFR